jgi:hypothetical protein
MKTSSYVSLTDPRGEQGWRMLPIRISFIRQVKIFLHLYPVGGEPSPSLSPNGGILRWESEIRAHYYL